MEDGSRQDVVLRLPARGLDGKDSFSEAEAARKPFVLTDVVGPDFCAWWREQVAQKLGSESVYFVEGDRTGERRLMQGTLSVFADECERFSCRDRFAYLQTDMLPTKAPELAAHLLQNLPQCIPTGSKNLLHRWPRGLRPAEMCSTIAGRGARSQLVLDDLQATQWHCCLAGHMRAKLLPNEAERLQPLQAAVEPFGIRDESGTPMFHACSRATSDIDLFATEFVEQAPVTHLDGFGPDLERWPDAQLLPRAMEVLLRAGEVLVIPGGWWVQLYFDEFSWVASSQYVGASSATLVAEAVLAHGKVSPQSIFGLQLMPPEQRLEAALVATLGAICGGSDGRMLLRKLRLLDNTVGAGVGTKEAEASQEQESSGGAGDEARQACDVCGRPAKTRCGRCRSFWLCGAECQRRSWPEHRKSCVRNPQH